MFYCIENNVHQDKLGHFLNLPEYFSSVNMSKDEMNTEI